MGKVTDVGSEKVKERLAFTIYNILKEFDPQKVGFMSLVRFYKGIYFVHKELKEREGINTGLPWYWFRYGPVVALGYCPQEVMEIVEFPGEEQRIFYGEEPKTLHLEAKEKETILKEIEELKDKYLKTLDIIEITYSDVKVGFLKHFIDFEAMMMDFKEKGIPTDIEKSTCTKLDKIAKSYPEKGFEGIFGLYLRFEEVLRILCKYNIGYLKSHINLIESFRELVVINASCIFNENLPNEWLEVQQEKLQSKKREFNEIFFEVEKEVFSKIYKKGEDRFGYSKKLMEISREMAEGG